MSPAFGAAVAAPTVRLRQLMADRPRVLTAILLVVLALVLRSPQYGNPVIQIDEQFYLLVGDRMLHGDLPFVDIWDRKPVGLFAIYAAIRLIGGDGVIQYQLVASVSAGATAFLIARLSARIAPPLNGIVAGALYLLFVMSNGGDGGQAPIFYNMFTAAAAYGVVRAMERAVFDRAAFYWACGAMLLMGCALQIKYSVLFEGVFFGLALVVTAWRRGGARPAIMAMAGIWMLLALVPTGIAWAAYAVIGEARAFVFANFVSVFKRPPSTGNDLYNRVWHIVTRTAPLALLAGWGSVALLRRFGGGSQRDIARFYACWALAAAGAVAVFGTYHEHYALPMLLPFAVAGAAVCGARTGPGWRFRGKRYVVPASLLIALIGMGMAYDIVSHARAGRGTGTETRAIADYVRPRLDDCLFVFSGDPILYLLTRSCLPSRLIFPSLMSESRDAATLDDDPVAELRRVMARHPRFIVSRGPGAIHGAMPAAMAVITPILSRDYRVALRLRDGDRQQILYERIER